MLKISTILRNKSNKKCFSYIEFSVKVIPLNFRIDSTLTFVLQRLSDVNSEFTRIVNNNYNGVFL